MAGRSLRVACVQLDEPQDDVAVAFAGPAHGPHAIDESRFDLDEALAAFTPHGPIAQIRYYT
jgi:hypothetical protein